MDAVAQVALITTSGTVLVALLGLAGNFFGESWREGRRRAHDLERAGDAERFESLRVFSGALLDGTNAWDWDDRLRVQGARVRFISTLRPGESQVSAFTAALTDRVLASRGPSSLTVAVAGTDQLFEWLRGDISQGDLALPPEGQVS